MCEQNFRNVDALQAFVNNLLLTKENVNGVQRNKLDGLVGSLDFTELDRCYPYNDRGGHYKNKQLFYAVTRGSANDCLINSFLICCSPIFRNLSNHDKDIVSSFFRRHYLPSLQEVFTEEQKVLLRSDGFLDDTILGTLGNCFKIKFLLLVVGGPNNPTNPRVTQVGDPDPTNQLDYTFTIQNQLGNHFSAVCVDPNREGKRFYLNEEEKQEFIDKEIECADLPVPAANKPYARSIIPVRRYVATTRTRRTTRTRKTTTRTRRTTTTRRRPRTRTAKTRTKTKPRTIKRVKRSHQQHKRSNILRSKRTRAKHRRASRR